MKSWFDISIQVCADDEDAHALMDAIEQLVCAGTGDGDDHRCGRDFVASIHCIPDDEPDAYDEACALLNADEAKRRADAS